MVQSKDGLQTRLEPDNRLIERAQTVAARLAERAQAADEARELPAEIVRDLHVAGLLTMNIPQALGGTEANLVTQLMVYEVIGGACASTCWCLSQHNQICQRIQGVLGDGSRPYIQAIVEEGAVLAHGVTYSAGTTHPVQGGFVSTGRWPFVSFSNHARWAFLNTTLSGPPPDWQPVKDNSDPPKSHDRQLLVNLAEPGVHIDKTWRAMSLRASMSNDVVLEDVFVPHERAVVVKRPPPGDPWMPNAPLALRIPASLLSIYSVGLALGIAKAALSETIEDAKGRSVFRRGSSKIHMPGSQFAVADAAMAIEAGRAFLFQEARSIVAKTAMGEAITESDQIRMHMAGLVARENAQQAVDRLFSIRGAHGLYETDNFQRYYRDIRMITLPAPQAPDLVREQVGKHLFGVAANVQPRWG